MRSAWAIRRSAGYRNFQENMGDAFMALKLRQEGVDVSGVVGDARAKGDPEHNTQPSLAAIGALTGSSLVGMNVRQLMVCAAQLVQCALRIG